MLCFYYLTGVSCYCKSSVTLSHVTMGSSAVRNLGISRSYSRFALFVANNTISSRKKLGLFSYVSKKSFLLTLPLPFKKCVG